MAVCDLKKMPLPVNVQGGKGSIFKSIGVGYDWLMVDGFQRQSLTNHNLN